MNLQPEVYSSVVLFLVLGALEEDEEEGEDEKTKIFSHFLNSESFRVFSRKMSARCAHLVRQPFQADRSGCNV